MKKLVCLALLGLSISAFAGEGAALTTEEVTLLKQVEAEIPVWGEQLAIIERRYRRWGRIANGCKIACGLMAAWGWYGILEESGLLQDTFFGGNFSSN